MKLINLFLSLVFLTIALITLGILYFLANDFFNGILILYHYNGWFFLILVIFGLAMLWSIKTMFSHLFLMSTLGQKSKHLSRSRH